MRRERGGEGRGARTFMARVAARPGLTGRAPRQPGIVVRLVRAEVASAAAAAAASAADCAASPAAAVELSTPLLASSTAALSSATGAGASLIASSAGISTLSAIASSEASSALPQAARARTAAEAKAEIANFLMIVGPLEYRGTARRAGAGRLSRRGGGRKRPKCRQSPVPSKLPICHSISHGRQRRKS